MFLLNHHRRKFHKEERLQLSDKNSILMTLINVYVINPVVMIDFGKVLCSSANELYQNSNASSTEDYIPQILAVLLEIHRTYI